MAYVDAIDHPMVDSPAAGLSVEEMTGAMVVTTSAAAGMGAIDDAWFRQQP